MNGFAPDLDPLTEGIFTDCSHFVPTERGFMAAPALSAVTPALSGPSTGAAIVTKVDDTKRVFAGTDTKVYEYLSGAWTDRSRAGNYTGARWRYDQFGDVTIGANGSSILQASTSGAFTDLTGSPIAKYVCVSNGFVMAFNGPVIMQDGWACSGLYDHTLWTPDPATQAANGRFLETPGPVVGARPLGNVVVVYKARSMFVGQYVGPPIVWQWTRIAGGEAGAISNECIVDVGYAHYFIGQDNFWVYDGTRPVPMDCPLRRWFFANSDPANRSKTVGLYDRYNDRIYWYFCDLNSGGVINRCIVYNVKTNKWGRDDNTIEAALQYVTPGQTYGEQWTSIGQNWQNWPNVTYETVFPAQGAPRPAVITSDHKVSLFTGGPQACSFTTGDIGDSTAVSLLKRFVLRFLTSPLTVGCQAFYKFIEGDALTPGAIGYYHDGRIDLTQKARYHRAQISFTGPVEVATVKPQLQASGVR